MSSAIRTAGNGDTDSTQTGRRPSGAGHDNPAAPAVDRHREVITTLSKDFGHNFAHVQIHPLNSRPSTDDLAALALTWSRTIAISPRFASESPRVRTRILAHELAHVIQQERGGSQPGASHEDEAQTAAEAVLSQRKPVVLLGATPSMPQRIDPPPAIPSWLTDVNATHVTGNIWEVQFKAAGPHYVGPYNELKKFTKKMGLTAEAHHIVGREHLADMASPYSHKDAPAIAVEPGIHRKVFTPRIGLEQAQLGGRRAGRASLTVAEVSSAYRSVYREQAPFEELGTISQNIAQQASRAGSTLKALSTATKTLGIVSQLYEPVAAAQQIHEAADIVGRQIGVPLGTMRALQEHPNLVPIANQINGQSFVFDPQERGPATLYRVIGNPLEAVDLHIRPGDLVKVAELWWQWDDPRWVTSQATGIRPLGWSEWLDGKRDVHAWISRYPDGLYYLNTTST